MLVELIKVSAIITLMLFSSSAYGRPPTQTTEIQMTPVPSSSCPNGVNCLYWCSVDGKLHMRYANGTDSVIVGGGGGGATLGTNSFTGDQILQAAPQTSPGYTRSPNLNLAGTWWNGIGSADVSVTLNSSANLSNTVGDPGLAFAFFKDGGAAGTAYLYRESNVSETVLWSGDGGSTFTIVGVGLFDSSKPAIRYDTDGSYNVNAPIYAWTNDGQHGGPTIMTLARDSGGKGILGNLSSITNLVPAPLVGNAGQCLQSDGSSVVYGSCGGAGALPAAGVAGRVPYDNGSTYTLTSPGLSGQVLHGGAAPSFGPVALSDISASVAVLNSAQNWSAAQTFMASGPVKINNVSDTFASTLASAATASRTFTLPDVTDTACGISATQTLSNKTLTTPVIASFTNAQHNHTTAAQGGSITVAAIADIAANYQPLSSDLIAIAALSATPGMLSRTGAATFAQRTLACSNATCSWTNGDGAAGAPTLLLNVGTGANSLCAGNDVRLGPAPSGGNSGQCLQSNGSALVYGACGGAGSLPSAGVAGRIPYDNGVSYSLASAGTSSQVLVGGTTPAFGAVNLTSMVTGILPSGNLPANNAYLNVTQNWSAPQTFQNAGPIKINNAADTFATTLATAASAARTFTLPDATDTACGLATTQTLSNKTLTTPVIASFTNAQHTHTNAAGGGVLDAGAITTGTFANARLTNPATTVNGQTCTLGSTCTVTVSLTTGVTGILPIGNGGTNSGTTLTGNRLMTSNSGATAIVEGNIYDWVVPEVTSTTTGGGVVDTTFTIPAAQGSDGTNGFLVSDLDFRVTRAPGGGGTVNIRCGLSAGGTELIVSTSAATLGQVIGDAVTELGTACPAAKQYNCYVNGAATVTCRLEAPVGTVSTALKGVWTFTGKRR